MAKTAFHQPSEASELQVKLLFSVKEVAENLAVSRSTVYSLFKAGALNFVKIGARRLVEAKELFAFVERMKVSTALV